MPPLNPPSGNGSGSGSGNGSKKRDANEQRTRTTTAKRARGGKTTLAELTNAFQSLQLGAGSTKRAGPDSSGQDKQSKRQRSRDSRGL